MKRILFILLLLSLLPRTGYCQKGADELLVGTFNVRFLDDHRPDYDYKFGGQPWGVRRPAVKAFFEQNPIDIIGLQEVRRTQAANLEEDFGKEWFIYCPGRLSGGKMLRTSDEATGVMFRRSRFNLLGHGCFWLSETPGDTASVRLGQKSPIITSWLHLEDKSARELWFFSAHISWSVAENPQLPDQEVETLLTEMERLSGFKREEFKSSPIFLVGDLNNSPEESAIKTLSRWFNDARLTCPESESTSRKTFNSWGKEKSAGIIDYIFYGEGKPEEYIVDNASYDKDVPYISDHYPVLMRLGVPPVKYCLTPEAPPQPRYNGPAVLGARPGHPIYFRLPFSGERPMKFSACGLPKGLKLDRKSGVVSGTVGKEGNYEIKWTARNKAGKGEGSLTLKVGDKIALTPPMGWNSWNCWGLEVSQEKVAASAKALIESGLADYGYSYINIDDAWQAESRSGDGSIIPNDRFPDIASFGDWLHVNGLKLGIYSSPGDRTCGGYLGSLGYEEKDAATWASWGVDYIKYDLCGYRKILKELPSVGKEEHIKPYLMMKDALAKQPRDIVYSICQYGLEDVWTWGEEAGGNLWRTTGDLTDKWERVVRIGFVKQRPAVSYSGPGHWNDPDMLVVGKVGWGEGLRDTRLTPDEQYSHVSLWALLAAPLIIGGDLAAIDKFTLNLLCNNEVIAVDQDPLGKQASLLLEEKDLQVWGRPLSDGSHAAGIFNMGEKAIEVNVGQILGKAGYSNVASCRDLWRQKDCPASFAIPSHGVLLIRFEHKTEAGIPTPVFDAKPEYVELYRTAWDQAKDHIKYQPGLVQPRYMDEGFRDEVIWIWDSEFMVMFCKYAPKLFPGIETLDNFYYTLHENAGSPLSVWHPDNPPFFAWVENDYYKFTADKPHIKELISKKRFLQKHFELFNTMNHDTEFPFQISNDGVRINYKGIGYEWQSWQSGMDNTPRKRAMPMFWIDAISQQALSALYISRLAKIAGDSAAEQEFRAKYEELKEKVNKYYWDEADGCYYDIKEDDLSKTHVLTPASFWPMLAEIPSQEQAEAMVRFALKDEKLGGAVPWVSVSRDDPDFDADGNYWKGSMWLPTAYMGIKALEKYGFFDEANRTAEAIVEHQWQTYSKYDPHTIWECYNPTKPEPASKKEGTKNVKSVKADFCGWSALGPISLLIENVLGFYDVDAPGKTVRWNLHQSCRHGIKDLSFGEITTDILYEDGKVSVVSNKPYTLYINGTAYKVRRGRSSIPIPEIKD